MSGQRGNPRQIISYREWPLEMRAETAAAYCDEPSVEAFKAKVVRGIYPQPVRERGCLPKWHREVMSHYIARRHGLRHDLHYAPKNLEHLI